MIFFDKGSTFFKKKKILMKQTVWIPVLMEVRMMIWNRNAKPNY